MKVLIVDDESLIRTSLKRVFEGRKHQVVVAENGQEGLDLWQKSNPDLVILDMLMPGLTGAQVLKNMGRPLRSKVILISAYTGEYDIKKASELGASLFIPKPFQSIFEVVERAEKLFSESAKINAE